MKKQFLLVLALISILGIFSSVFVSAQDEEEELPPCDSMELMTNIESLMEPLEAIGEMTTVAASAEPSDYSAMVADIDAFVGEYWLSVEETEFSCAEEYYIAYSMGLALEELLIVSELSALAVHESAAENTDAATTFSELTTARSEMLAEDMTAFTDIMTNMMTGEIDMGGDFDACSEEDIAATGEGIGTINETFLELGASIEGASGADLSAVVIGFATLSGEYWMTFMPEVPECAEAQEIATGYGLILDESLIMVGLIRLAELETEAGNDELATAFAESATARAEALTAAAEELFGSGEE